MKAMRLTGRCQEKGKVRACQPICKQRPRIIRNPESALWQLTARNVCWDDKCEELGAFFNHRLSADGQINEAEKKLNFFFNLHTNEETYSFKVQN